MAVKPRKITDNATVNYSAEHWRLLDNYRKKATDIITILQNNHLHATHGSVARGDVTCKSDVDIFIPEVQSSFIIETTLEKAKIPINSRILKQATPNYTMKGHIEIDETTIISFPLMEIRRVECEFYQFGGEVNLAQLQDNLRVPGIDKRLMLIELT